VDHVAHGGGSKTTSPDEAIGVGFARRRDVGAKDERRSAAKEYQRSRGQHDVLLLARPPLDTQRVMSG